MEDEKTRRDFLKHAAAFAAVAGMAESSSATAQDCNGGCTNPDGCGGDGGCSDPEGCDPGGGGDCFYGYSPGCIGDGGDGGDGN